MAVRISPNKSRRGSGRKEIVRIEAIEVGKSLAYPRQILHRGSRISQSLREFVGSVMNPLIDTLKLIGDTYLSL
jgi:hypothetical protein